MLAKPSCGGRSAIPLILFWFTWGASESLPADECASVVARAVSVQGRVEATSGDAPAWAAVYQGDSFCAGDHLRVGANSRASIALNDETLLRLAENSSVRINAPREDGSAWLDLLQGIAHFISRVRQTFQVDTPFVNANIEGTEFTVGIAQDRATVSVLEGSVRASNQQGEVRVEGGQRALALAGRPPRVEAVVAPLDAVQWALYYPPVIEPATAQAPAAVRQAVEADRRGDLEAAFSALAQIHGIDRDAGLLVYRASLQLQVGGTDAARRDLDAALRLTPAQPDALALRSIIATVQNERDQALDLAQQAVASDPRAAAPLLTLSYARQARFELREALDAADRATQVAPDNALAWARLARLQLMFRHMDAALAATDRAVEIDPGQAQTQTTLGFAQLTRLDLAGAQTAFDKAAALDQAAPLPRLGLGLVEIRRGNLSAGRRLIETAANQDPGNALIRSYLGKAYYEERRDKRAATQFALAKQFDDLDPTAWFYDAILKQSENRPLEALSDLQSAIARNDNRAVYRSRLLLDDDQAARSASLARIYDDLGFGRLALKESWKSLAAEPANPSAHRFLSDAYTEVPRHEIARVSERLQAQLLTPEIVAPVSPSASEAGLFALQGGGPSLAGYNEYNPLFNRQRLAFLASGVIGSNNTRGEELAVGGFTNRGMLSAGYYRESSDGFRENNDSTQTIKNLFGQFRLTTTLSVQGEIRHREGEFGDMMQRFDPSIVFADLRRNVDSDSRRLGVNFSPNPGNSFLLSAISQELDDQSAISGNQFDSDSDGDQYEAAYLYHGRSFNLSAGLGDLKLDTTTQLTLPFFGILPPSKETLDQQTGYLYLTLLGAWGEASLGYDYVNLDNHDLIDRKKYNPKLGLMWNVSDATLIRFAAFKTLRPEIMDNQTLMPTQLAGFNQVYDDFLGTQAERYGIGVDHRFDDRIDGGIELSRRNVDMLLTSPTLIEESQRELSHKAYLNWRINDRFKLGGEYRYEKFNRDHIDGLSEPDRPAMLDTRSLTLSGGYFHPSGVFVDLTASHVDQEIEQLLFTTGTASDSDTFWISDLALGYRIPGRRGLLKLQVKNLFDTNFNYQSIYPGTGTPQSSAYYPERSVFLNAHFWF